MQDPSAGTPEGSSASSSRQSLRSISRRVQLACHPCRSAKLKCDKTLPTCQQCFKRSREAECKYTERGMRYNVATQNRSAIQEKIDRLEQFVSRMGGTPADPGIELDQASSTTGNEQQDNTQLENFLVFESGGERWVSSAHWQSVARDITDIRAYLSLQDELSEVYDNAETSEMETLFDPVIGMPNIASLQDVLKELPLKTELDMCISAWFDLPDTIQAILHGPTFQQQYLAFWENPVKVQPAWLALLLVISHLGSVILSRTSDDPSIKDLAARLERLACYTLIRTDTTKPQPHLIEALILYTMSQLYRSSDVTSRAWHVVGLVIRLCYQAGYHREPSTNPRFSMFECEMRRRIWMSVQQLEISIGTCAGMVSVLDTRLSDTKLPSNLLDTDFSKHQTVMPRAREDYTTVQVEISLYGMARLMNEAHMTHYVKTNQLEIENLYERLQIARNDLPQKLKMKPIEESMFDSPSEIIDRHRVELHYLRATCLLYCRYLGEADFTIQPSRCVTAATSIVNTSINLLEAAQPGRRLASLKLMTARHIHDFDFAAVLLCSQLKHNSSEKNCFKLDEAEGAKIHSLLLRACQLWKVPGTPSTQSQVALSMISRFLSGQETQVPPISGSRPATRYTGDLQSIQIGSSAASYGVTPTHNYSSLYGLPSMIGEEDWFMNQDVNDLYGD